MSEQRFPEEEPVLGHEPDTEPGDEQELKDAGRPAGGVADPEGSSGAEEGISPLHDEAYSQDPEGPTTSTGD